MKSLFVHDPRDLNSNTPGGVQICSREFLDVVRAASSELMLTDVTVSRFWAWRMRRKLGLGSYCFYRPNEYRVEFQKIAANFQPTHVFLNRCELLRLAPLAKETWPDTQVIVMSHGNQSGDDLYEVAGPEGRYGTGLVKIKATWQIGTNMVNESHFRHRHLDGVCVMSHEEEVLERWLGAKRTMVIPRMVKDNKLEWQPVSGRAGFVGTLSHTPNRIALDELCKCLSKCELSNFQLRVAGGPEHIGQTLDSHWPFVTYIGSPDEESLQREVATWSVFANPIFWLSKGASMKLGQALAWSIPTVSTRSGARGYVLIDGEVTLTDDAPESFANKLVSLSHNFDLLSEQRKRLLEQSTMRPNLQSVGDELQTWACGD